MTVDPSAVDRLIDLGRRQGFVTTAQIDREMPVEDLTEIEIAEIVDRLERAGVPVELEEGVRTDRLDGPPTEMDGSPVIMLRRQEEEDGPGAAPSRPARAPDSARPMAAGLQAAAPDGAADAGRGVGGWGLVGAMLVAVAFVTAIVLFALVTLV